MKKEITRTTEEQEWYKALDGVDIKTIQKMIEDGFNVNYHDKNSWPALHIACLNRNYDIVKLLIEKGADVNIKDENGWTALHEAGFWGEISIIKLLIDSGVDITAKDDDGYTSFSELKQIHPRYYQELMEWLSEEYPEKLLEYIASDNTPSKSIGLSA